MSINNKPRRNILEAPLGFITTLEDTMSRPTLAVLAFTLSVSISHLRAQDIAANSGRSTVLGTVTDSAGPLTGAFLRAFDLTHRQVAARLTDRDGRFRLDLARGATYEIRAEHIGYADRSLNVHVESSQPTIIALRLDKEPIMLAPLEVDAKPNCHGMGTAATAQLWFDLR